MKRIGPREVRLDLDEIAVVDYFNRLLDEGLSPAEAVAKMDDEAGTFNGRDDLRAYLLT